MSKAPSASSTSLPDVTAAVAAVTLSSRAVLGATAATRRRLRCLKSPSAEPRLSASRLRLLISSRGAFRRLRICRRRSSKIRRIDWSLMIWRLWDLTAQSAMEARQMRSMLVMWRCRRTRVELGLCTASRPEVVDGSASVPEEKLLPPPPPVRGPLPSPTWPWPEAVAIPFSVL